MFMYKNLSSFLPNQNIDQFVNNFNHIHSKTVVKLITNTNHTTRKTVTLYVTLE